MRTLLIDTIDTVIFLSSLLIQERKCGRLASEGPSDSNVLGNFSTQFSLSFLLQVSSRRAKRYLFSWSLLRLGFPTAQGFLNTFKGTYLIHFCQHLMSIRLDVILIFSCQKKKQKQNETESSFVVFQKGSLNVYAEVVNDQLGWYRSQLGADDASPFSMPTTFSYFSQKMKSCISKSWQASQVFFFWKIPNKEC